MPEHFRLVVDPERNLVYLHAAGRVTMSDLMRLREAILTHPAFRPGMDLIADVRHLRTEGLSLTDIGTIASLQLWHSGRRAFVTASPAQAIFARVFAAFRDPSTPAFVGSSLAEGLEWLGHPGWRPDDFAHLSPSVRLREERDAVVTRQADGCYRVEGAGVEPFSTRQWDEARLNAARRRALGSCVWFRDGEAGRLVEVDVDSGTLFD